MCIKWEPSLHEMGGGGASSKVGGGHLQKWEDMHKMGDTFS